MRRLKCGVLGIIVSGILLAGLMAPHDAFAESIFKKSMAAYDDCAKCPSELDKKSDPDRKGHKVKKTPVKKEPPKKEPPKKTPPKKEPPKKVAPKPPAKKK